MSSRLEQITAGENPAKTHTVALVEDDRSNAELLSISINQCSRLKVAAIYLTAEEALRDLPKVRPEVVLMDIQLPGMDGIQCVRELRSLTPRLSARILMLTGYEDYDALFESLKAGAHGYLLKEDTSTEALRAAIVEVIRRGAPFSPGVAQRVIGFFHALGLAAGSETLGSTGSPAHLSAREEQFLELLVVGLSYKQIADRLAVSIDSTRKHLQSIYRKLHINSRSEATFHWLSRRRSGASSNYIKM